jgi:hypothetical protein
VHPEGSHSNLGKAGRLPSLFQEETIMRYLSQKVTFLLLWGAVAAISVLGVQEDHRLHAGAPGLGAVVDGSKTPDLISDAIAWRLFLRALSEPDGLETKVARAKTDAIGLDPDDAAVFRSILATFHSEVPRVEQRIQSIGRASPGTAPYAEIARLRTIINQLAVDVQNRLETGLSKDGAKKVRDFVRAHKKHMKVIELPATRAKED